MRTIKLLFAVLLFFVISQSYAVDVSKNSTKLPKASCTGDYEKRVLYVGGQTLARGVWDNFYSNKDMYISTKSKVGIWTQGSNLLSGCNSASQWSRPSEVAPGKNIPSVAVSANCIFKKPTNKNERNIQFVYNIKYSPVIQKSGNSSATKQYYVFQSGKFNKKTKVYPRYKVRGDYKFDKNECLDVELRYCGDGILEPGNGETCDPEDATKRGWGNGGCNVNTCKPITTPVCKSLSVNKTIGTAPTNVVATCKGYKVNNWKIDCGNGQTFTGNGSNTGEQTFSKTCNYTTGGNYTPKCYINNTITSSSCKKSVKITNPVPSIVVDKRDANVFDLDNNVGNDTQTVNPGEKAVFKITVTNNGKEALKNVVLSDPVETSCNRSASQTLALIKKVGNKNNYLEPGESFSYTCQKTNTQSNYTNTVGVSGIGVISGKSVKDSDPTKVVVKRNPNISVVKRDENNADLDNNIGGNDSQTVTKGDDAVFRITVKNNGTEDLKNVLLVDAKSLSCGSNGFVNLQSKNFKNKANNAVVNIAVSGAGNHSDNIFQVGEVFTYTCKKANTQSDYTNVVDVSGIGTITGKKVDDTDPTKIIIANTPAIEVVKEDANSADLDSEQFNDTQTVTKGSEAVFHITVKNTGDEDLKNITLSDPQAASCATKTGTVVNLNTKKFTNGDDIVVTIFPDGAGNHNDNIFQIGEEFTFTCNKGNTQSNYTNIIEVAGVGVDSGTSVDDDDPSVVIVEDPVYDLALRKTLSTSTPGPFSVGSTVTFDITVYNQGNVDSGSVEVTDYIPTGLTFIAGNGWTQADDKLTQTISNIPEGGSTVLNVSFTIADNAPNSITNIAEISDDSGDDCDSTPDNDNTNDGTPVNDDIGTGCDEGGDEDDHDPETIVLGTQSLDLIKSLAPGQSTNVSVGDTVNYIIKVRNTGNTTITNQKVEDHFPAGLTLAHSNWTLVSGETRVARHNTVIASIAPDQVIELPISFTVNSGVTGTLRNLAVVCAAGDETCEPVTPPTCEDSAEEGNAEGCEEVTVGGLDLIKSLAPGQSTTVNVGDTVNYIIKVRNTSNVTITNQKVEDHFPAGLTLANSNWTLVSGETRVARHNTVIASIAPDQVIELPISFTVNSGVTGTLRNLAVVCAAGDDTCNPVTPPTCNDTAEVGNPEGCEEVTVPGSTGGSGGSTYKCNDIVRNNSNTVTCYGNSKVKSMYVSCDGVDSAVKTATRDSNGRRTASFTCSSSNVECKVYRSDVNEIGNHAWRTSSACKLDTPVSCGNGVVDGDDQCDAGTDNGKNGVSCTQNCKIKDCNTTGQPCVLTWPNGGEMVFGPSGTKIIGHNDNPLEKLGLYPVLENKSDYDLSFDELCVLNNNSDGSLVGDSKCVDIPGDKIYPGEELYIIKDGSGHKVVNQYSDDLINASYPVFKGNKNVVSGDYGTSILTTTIKDDGVRHDNSYFAGKLEVRVAKPAVATTGGGTSYVKASTTADVAEVTKDVYTESNTNFVGVSATSETDAVSSNVATLDSDNNEEAVNDIEVEQDTYEASVEENSIDTSDVNSGVLENYNGLSNVFIMKGGNLKTSDIIGLGSITEPRTYIVEDGDLIVDTDELQANKNIAFVVKNGDIIVNDNVKHMDGTYIVLGDGEMRADESGEQLVVNGSLYGNIDNLVANRYYISDDNSGQLSVGTIVSFGSGLFSKPAPLVSQFVGEYLESEKVAR